MPFIRSISGIRATLGDGLIPQQLIKYVVAYCNSLDNKGPVVVGRDGRPSGRWIKNLVLSAVNSTGRNVIDIDIAPTPTVQLMTEKSEAAGGISITASHNPKEWNGLKFLNKEGVFLNKSDNEIIWDAIENDEFLFNTDPYDSSTVLTKDGLRKHLESIFNLEIFDTKSIEKIREKKYKVVVDAVNASGSNYIPALLHELGCEIINLYTDNTGIFPHTPEPIPENLGKLCEKVKSENADLGIAVDPDADRLVLIDENGEPIGEEKTIAITGMSVVHNIDKLASGKFKRKIAVNLSTSAMIELIAEENNIKVLRSPVGEINVVEKMKETNAVFGGEGSGGVILPHSHYGRDSLVGTAILLLFMCQTDKKLSILSAECPDLYMHKTKFERIKDPDQYIDKFKSHYQEDDINEEDGVRVKLSKTDWIQLRASNTEPIMRIMAESDSLERAKQLCDDLISVLNG